MMRRPQLRWLVLATLVLLGPRTCTAVIIIEKNVAEPIRGYLVSEDEVRVIVDVLLPNGDTRQRVFPRSSIEEMIQAVSTERLAALRSDRPQDYRDYAEELAGKTNDPDAQRTAIRLYQIAAYLAPQELGRSGLLGMVSLARSPEEERKFRAAAYLLDPAHNRSVLRSPTAAKRESTKEVELQKRLARTFLRLLREGKLSDARTASHRSEVQSALKVLAPALLKADYSKLKPGDPLPPELLREIVAAELALTSYSAEKAEEASPKRSTNWDQAIEQKAVKPVPVLALEYLTEFDPRDCHFRNGKWGK